MENQRNFELDKSIQNKLNQNIAEYYDKFHAGDENLKIVKVQIQENIKNMDAAWAKQQLQYLAELSDEYYSNIISVGYEKTSEKKFGGCASNNYDMSLLMFYNTMSDEESFTKRYSKSSKTGFSAKVDDKNINKAVIYHEFAHSLTNSDNKYRKNIGKELEIVYNEYKKEIFMLKKDLDIATKKAFTSNSPKDWESAYLKNEEYNKIFVSNYANSNWEEFASECFSNRKLNSNSSTYSKTVVNIIDKYYKRRK